MRVEIITKEQLAELCAKHCGLFCLPTEEITRLYLEPRFTYLGGANEDEFVDYILDNES